MFAKLRKEFSTGMKSILSMNKRSDKSVKQGIAQAKTNQKNCQSKTQELLSIFQKDLLEKDKARLQEYEDDFAKRLE